MARSVRRALDVSSLPPLLTADRRRMLVHFAETMAFALAGGASFGMIGVPGGWLSGAILSVCIAALAGRSMHVPMPLNRTIFVIVGISLGSVVTPATLQGLATYPVSVLALVMSTVAITYAGSFYLTHVHGWDRVSATLAATPGALSQVMVVAAETKADIRGIAIVQTIRIGVLSVGVPGALAMLGLASASRVGGDFHVSAIDELAILIAVATVSAIIAYRIRFPGGLMFGAMIASAVLHAGGWIQAAVPWWVTNAAMIALGGVVGSRFANTSFSLLLRFALAALGTFVISLVVAGAFAAAVIIGLKLPAANVTMAFSPGAVDVMLLLAVALTVDPIYVGAHHLARIFFVSLTVPVTVLRAARAERKVVGETKVPPSDPPFED